MARTKREEDGKGREGDVKGKEGNGKGKEGNGKGKEGEGKGEGGGVGWGGCRGGLTFQWCRREQRCVSFRWRTLTSPHPLPSCLPTSTCTSAPSPGREESGMGMRPTWYDYMYSTTIA